MHRTVAMARARRRNRPLGVLLLALLYATFFVALVLRDRVAAPNARLSSHARDAQLMLRPVVRAGGYPENFCSGDTPSNLLRSSNAAWLALLLPLVLFLFVGLAVVTDDYFVASLEKIVLCLELSEDVAGATFMAAGSSAPELFTSMISTLGNGDDLGIGTIVGSAVFNICVIIGVSALFAPEALRLDPRPLVRDAFFYVVSVMLLLVSVLFWSRGAAKWWEGLILILAYVAYILFMAYGNKRYFKRTKKWVRSQLPIETVEPSDITAEFESTTVSTPELLEIDLKDDPVRINFGQDQESQPNAERKTVLGVELPESTLGWVTFPPFFVWKVVLGFTIPDCSGEKQDETHFKFKVFGRKLAKWPYTFSMSILWIMAISYAMVEAARIAGCFMRIPSAVMGLTILAAGTSVPDALASIAVVKDGRGDMAVSNAIGSNVFDVLLGLGLPWFVGGLIKRSGVTVTVDPVGLVVIPIAILFAIIVLLLAILPLFKWRLGKPLGYFLFGVYALFVTYSLLDVFVFRVGGAAHR